MFLKHASTIFSSPVKWRVMFTGVLGMIFCSIFGTAIFGCGAAFALDSSANFSVVVPEVNTLEITLSDSNLVLNLTPQMAEASFGSKDLTITVGTSNIAGYNLMMNTSNTALTSAAEDTIESLDEDEDGYVCSTETCNFTLNRWGFKKSTDDAYNYIPSSVSLASNDAPTNGEDTTINFASRVDAQQPAGTYSTTLTFVATVNPTSISDISQIKYLQDFATLTLDEYNDVVSSMTEGTAYEKSDSRDEKTYNIAKLADGNIWFLDNLRLDPSVKDLTSADTNVTATVAASTFTNKTSGWTGDEAYTSAWFNLDSETTEVSYGSGTNYVGGYYNYCAASAGSYCMDKNSGSGNASQDLCPAGWRMPTGGTNGEYQTLYNQYGAYSTFKEVFRASLSGGFLNASAIYQGSHGNFWSSTLANTGSMYLSGLDGSKANPVNYGSRAAGNSIRCALKIPMQGQTAASLASRLPSENSHIILTDLRDKQDYDVAKLADGKIWMTKNLNLAGGTTIDSYLSDIPSGYDLPTENGFQDGNKLPATEVISSGVSLVNSSAFSDHATAYIFNGDSADCSDSTPCYSYYSWTAATVGSGVDIIKNNVDAPYSICPKGWKLPNTRTDTDDTSDFRALLIANGGSSAISTYNTSTTPSGAVMYSKITASPTPNFLLTGRFYNGSINNGDSNGYYWTSTCSGDSIRAKNLRFHTTLVQPIDISGRSYGFAVRCLLSN